MTPGPRIGAALAAIMSLMLPGAPGAAWCLGSPQAAGPPPQGGTAGGRGRLVPVPPPQADAKAEYLFYLHGRIIQEQGRGAVSPEHGAYEYDAILRGFADAGFVVVSEVRPRGTEGLEYADRIAGQIRRLLDAGVPARRVTVVGASMGGSIAMLVSSRLKPQSIGYVIMGSCGDDTRVPGAGLHGEMLSIFEASDEIGGSCAPLFAGPGAPGRHAEVRLDTGLRHGFLYRPLPEWMGPVIRWARERAI